MNRWLSSYADVWSLCIWLR